MREGERGGCGARRGRSAAVMRPARGGNSARGLGLVRRRGGNQPIVPSGLAEPIIIGRHLTIY